MAKAQTFIPGEITETVEVEAENYGLHDDEQAAFEKFRESFTGEQMGTLRVLRIPNEQIATGGNKGSIKGVFLFACPVDKYTFDELLTLLRDTYGSGTYRVIGVAAGRRGIVFNRIFDVEAPISAPPPVNAAPANDLGTIVAQLGALMMRQTQQIVEAVRPALPVADPLDQFKKFAEVMALVRGSAPEAPRTDLLGEIQRVKDIAEALGMGRGGDGETNTADVFLGMIREWGPTIRQAVEGMQNRQPPPMIPASPTPSPQPNKGNSDMSAPPTPAPQDAFIRSQAKQLLMFAESGVPAETLARQIVDTVPDDALDKLEDFAATPDAVAQLIAALPPGNEHHAAWFSALREALLKEFAAMDASDGDAPGEDVSTG